MQLIHCGARTQLSMNTAILTCAVTITFRQEPLTELNPLISARADQGSGEVTGSLLEICNATVIISPSVCSKES